MSSEGQPLQFDLFSGELVDNRSDYQKRVDKERQQPQQPGLFTPHDEFRLAQNVRPWLAQMPQPHLVLEIQDVRSEEERDREIMKASERLTQPLFGDVAARKGASEVKENALVDNEPVEYRVTLFELGKVELIESSPHFKEKIEQLKDTDIESLALQAEDALRAVYTMVLNITLTNFFAQNDQ